MLFGVIKFYQRKKRSVSWGYIDLQIRACTVSAVALQWKLQRLKESAIHIEE